ncbi:acyl-CoA dehydrogenase NM domain-like protein, partial [Aureobasidium melanogenum]
MSGTYSKADVQSHNKPDNLWIIVDEDVYDMTKFQEEHPGGKKILQRVAGKDASKQFWKYHNEAILKKYQKQLQIGSLDSKAKAAPPTPPATPPPAAKKEKEIVKPEAEPGVVAPEPGADAKEVAESLDQFGDLIPGGDPNWYQSYHSPYFNQSHADLRAEVREWMENEIIPNVTEWDEAKKVPDSVYKAMGERGYLAGLMGSHYPTHVTDKRVKSVATEKWDLFHELCLTDEISRAGSGGFVWNLIGGFAIGAPPVLKHGKKELVERIMPGILSGDKRICLAITEPDAGSDVANVTCEAKLSDDGKHYIVNGEKKWITNGVWADYFTTAVRTGGEGMNGISVLLIERSFGGVSTRRMDCQGVWSSGTTYVTFEDVKVP